MADPPNASYPSFQPIHPSVSGSNFTANSGNPGNIPMTYGPPKTGQGINQSSMMFPQQPNGQTGPHPQMRSGPPVPGNPAQGPNIGGVAPGPNYNGFPPFSSAGQATSASVNNFNGPPSTGPMSYQGPRTGAGPPGGGPRPNMAMMNGPIPTQPRQPMTGPSVRTNFPPGPQPGPPMPSGPPTGPLAGPPPLGGQLGTPRMSTPPPSAQNLGQKQQMPVGSNFSNVLPHRGVSPGQSYPTNVGQQPWSGGQQFGPPPTSLGRGGPQPGPPPPNIMGHGGATPPPRPGQGGPPPTSMGPGGQRWVGPPPTITAPSTGEPTAQVSGRPTELPVPFHGQGQYSHQIGDSMKLTPGATPNNSEPVSQRSSRAPSPVTSPTYDALEGQFTPSAQGHASSGVGTPPPLSGSQGSSSPGPTPTNAPPTQGVGITGRRVYPFMPAQPNYAAQPSDSPRPNMPPMSTAGPQQPMYQPGPGSQSGPSSGLQQFRFQQPGPQTGPQSGLQPGFPPGPPSGFQPGPQSGPPSGFQPGPQSGPPTGFQPGPQRGPPSGFQPGPQSGPPSGFQPGPQSGPSSGFQPGPQSGPPSGFQPGPQSGPPSGFQPGPQSGPPSGFQAGQQQPGFPMPQVGQQSMPKNYPNSMGGVNAGFGQMALQDNTRAVNLLQEKQLILPTGVETPKPNLQHDFKKVNCNPDVFRCTLTTIPQTSALLNKARLPLGILIHPFKDLSQLPVIQSSVIVRCRSCRTYINPFVYFVDTRRWKCNLCYRVNDLPDEFSFDPISKTYGDPQRRPEVRSSTIEFIAPSEYMLRPPQPAVYLFVIDVSFNAVETGYLNVFCETLLDELDKLPGDARTLIGFVAFDRAVHFFNLAEGLSQPQLMTVSDVDDIFLPSPDNLLVNIHESKDLIIDLLNQLPTLFEDNKETGNALGAALQAAYKMMCATGGRVTVMQTCLPTAGPGALSPREDPSQRTSKTVQNLGPATDFYKKLALDCSAQQIAVDLFMMNGQYSDISTLACISKYSSGSLHSYPSFQAQANPPLRDRLESDLRRYFTRKIGFEAVMRIRCTKGLSIHTFHGNFFVRSTDLLSLPNINPDAGFGMQMSIEDSLTDTSTVCFQAALLYTSSKGERRIRVHTLCLPVSNQINEVIAGADQLAIVGLVAKMAVDRSVTASLNEAREAMINSAVDALTSFGNTLPNSQRTGNLMSSFSLRLVPLFVSAMLKSMAFRSGPFTKLDDRYVAMEQCKTQPLSHLMLMFYPSLYPVHSLTDEDCLKVGQITVPQPPLLRLSSANLDRHGSFLMDTGENMYMLVGSAISDQFCQDVFDRPNFMALEDGMHELPELENATSERLRNFVNYILDQRPYGVTFTVLREDSKARGIFFQHMIEDRTDASMSYYEFLQFLQKQVGG